MFHNRKKSWILFSLLSTSATIVPLTSCGSDGTVIDIGGFDKEFGFDALTYNRLEKQFQDLYWSKLLSDNEKYDNKIVTDKFNNFCNVEIANLRNKLFNPANNYSYTTRTNTLINYASQQYDINLVRSSKISISDFTSLKESSLESYQIYMSNLELSDDEKTNFIDKFSTSFDEILVDCIKHSSDMAIILLELKSRLIECCSELNDECTLAATYSVLKQFLNDYKFIVKDESVLKQKQCLWDELIDKALDGDFIDSSAIEIIPNQKVNKPIKASFINNIFDLKSTNNIRKNYTLTANNLLTSYSNDIIPGYTLTPVLVTMDEDIYSNEYNINIDWQLMSNKYLEKDAQKQKEVTAHCVLDKDDKMKTMEKFSLDDVDVNDYQFNQYKMFATNSYQQNNLIKAYFTDSNNSIKFTWDTTIRPSLNNFLPSNVKFDQDKLIISDKNEYDQQMLEKNLADSGLRLNNVSLTTLIEQEDQDQKQQIESAINSLTNQSQLLAKDDSKLSIEKNFVKYCVVNANNHVKFNSTTANTITSSFVVGYKNTLENRLLDKQFVNHNLGFSKEFIAEAVKNYNDVVGYVNTQLDPTTLSSLLILNTLIIVGFIAASVFIALIIAQNFLSIGASNYATASSKQKLIVYVIIGMVVIAWWTWLIGINSPLQEQNNNISYWNNAVKNGTIKLNIYDNIQNDSKYCANEKDFDAYSKTNLVKSFELYWYYSHFVDAIDNNDDDSGIASNKATEDFKQFIDLRSKYEVTIHESAATWVGVIVIVLVLTAAIITCLIIRKQLSIKEKEDGVNWDQPTKNIVESNDNIVKMRSDSLVQLQKTAIDGYTDFDNAINY